MPVGRRLATLLLVLALVGAPAVVLRVLCVGNGCDGGGAAARAGVPFCPLPSPLRRQIQAGFREGRSPDVMAATTQLASVWTRAQDEARVPWPGGARPGSSADVRVPIAFFGGGIEPGARLGGAALDAIAPTLEPIAGFRRDHPEVRTGATIEGVVSRGAEPTPLIVLIAWKGMGTPDLEADPQAWPFLERAIENGSGTTEAVTGSLPIDPAATLTTIGTGASPARHGITGTVIRDDRGVLRRAWSTPDAGSVIASLADDLDHTTSDEAGVGAVLTDPADRGIIGDGWYLGGGDRDRVTLVREPQDAAAASGGIVVSSALGADDVTDLLGVVLEGSINALDARTAEVVQTIRASVPGATFVVAGTGSLGDAGGIDATTLATDVETVVGAPVVARTAADGFFLDRAVLVERSLTAQQVADALSRQRSPDDTPLFAGVFPSFAVAFSRYC